MTWTTRSPRRSCTTPCTRMPMGRNLSRSRPATRRVHGGPERAGRGSDLTTRSSREDQAQQDHPFEEGSLLDRRRDLGRSRRRMFVRGTSHAAARRGSEPFENGDSPSIRSMAISRLSGCIDLSAETASASNSCGQCSGGPSSDSPHEETSLFERRSLCALSRLTEPTLRSHHGS
jgi:hypothetical protein